MAPLSLSVPMGEERGLWASVGDNCRRERGGEEKRVEDMSLCSTSRCLKRADQVGRGRLRKTQETVRCWVHVLIGIFRMCVSFCKH